MAVQKDPPLKFSLDDFWSWLQMHPNCILRAGTPEIILFDDEDYHWVLWNESPETRNIQLMHGKRAVAEMFVVAELVDSVHAFPAEAEGEFIFELLNLKSGNAFVTYFFVMSHGPDEPEGDGRVH